MRLINATALVKVVLAERDKIPLNIAGLPHRYGDAMRGGIRKALRCIETAPTIDAEPVVRCKDCKEYIPWMDGYICGRIGSYYGNTKPNDYCSHGAKMDEEVQE